AVHAEGGERLEVGLNAGTASRVAAGDCQGCGHTLEFCPVMLAVSRTATMMDHALADAAGSALPIRLGATLFVALLTAASSQVSVPLPFTPVPFTLQPMVVLLGAAVLGPELGLLSQVLYLTAGAAGLPVFAFAPDLPQGAARLLGPTGG